MNEKSRQGSETQDKKALILGATTRLLRSRGLQAFSFDAVANEAGMSRQLVRYYYPSLDELIVDLCDYLAMTYQDSLAAGIVNLAQVERLGFFLDYFFGMSEGHPMPDNIEVYDAFFAYAVASEPLRLRMRETYKTLGQVVMHELAIAHPQLAPGAREELSFLFVSMMHAHWSYVATLGFSRQHNRLARTAFDRLIASYLREEPTASSAVRPWTSGD